MKTVTRILCFTFLLSAFSFRAAAEEFTNAIRAYLQQCVHAKIPNGCIVVGMVDEHGSKVISYGKLDNSTDREADGDTVFGLHSTTGTFTRLLLQDMVVHGQMKLDDPVAKYLPASVKVPTRNGKEITVRNLAAETSGFPPHSFGNVDTQRPDNPLADYTVGKMYAFISGCQLTCDPGARHAHGSVGLALLGQAIALKAGTNLESLLVDRICRPLNMDSTRFLLTPELKLRLASEHNPFGYAKPDLVWGALMPLAGLYSTANDLLKFVSAFELRPFNLTPLVEKSVVTDDQSAANAEQTLSVPPARTLLCFGGGGFGGSSFVCFDKTLHRGVVVLSTADDTGGNLGLFLLENCGWHSDRRPTETNLNPRVYDSYVGQYRATGAHSPAGIGIRREGDRLFVQITGSNSWPVNVLLPPGTGELLPEAENCFFERLSGTPLTFSRNLWGKVTGLTARYQGNTFAFKKISNQPPAAPEPFKPPVVLQLDAKCLDAVVGQYEFAPNDRLPSGLKVAIRRGGDQLFWQEEALVINLYPESETNFFDKIAGLRLTFIKNRQGEATAVVVRDMGRPDLVGRKLSK